MKLVSIILPVYNGEKYLMNLVRKIREQVIDFNLEIIAPVSKSIDNSYSIARELCDIAYIVDNFDHAKTRHQAALKSKGEILVFITQDILPYNEHWLSSLIKPLLDRNDIVASYSRQVAYPQSTSTEKLMREFNYPKYDRECNINTKNVWGRKNIYYSDSSSATLRNYFFDYGGYNFNVGTNEDVVYALNIIKNKKSIKYTSDSIVYHSHDFEIKSAYDRYKLIGQFEKEYEEELREYSSLGEGKKLLFFLLKNLLKSKEYKELLLLPINLSTRFIGYRAGNRSN